MPGTTRSGKEFIGVSKSDTLRIFDEYRTVELEGFRLNALLRPAQEAQAQHPEGEADAPLSTYSLRPRPLSNRTYSLTPIAQLAKFRPLNGQRKRSTSKIHAVAHKALDLKRRHDRTKRAAARLHQQNLLGTRVKGYQRAHVRETQSSSLTVDFDFADSLFDGPTWTGDRDDGGTLKEQGAKTLKEACSVPGMKVLRYDGRTNLLLRDEDRRPIVYLARKMLPAEAQHVERLFEDALKDLNLVGTEYWHRRGAYYTRMFGVSFGGGQTRPATFKHTANDRKVWDNLRTDEVVHSIARRVDYLLGCYFPHLHHLYSNVLDDLCANDSRLERNWDDCCFAATSINLNNAVTWSHRDYLNLLFGMCAIYCCGDFDYTKGGHLILWDLKLIVEFPPGCIAFLPSALIRHANTSIQPGETRHSMAFFSASGLFRWRHNNFMSDKDFLAGASVTERAEWEAHKASLWQTGLDLLKDMQSEH